MADEIEVVEPDVEAIEAVPAPVGAPHVRPFGVYDPYKRTLKGHIEAWKGFEKRRAKTAETYEKNLHRWVQWLAEERPWVDPRCPSGVDVQEYKGWLEDQCPPDGDSMAPATANMRLTAVRSFYKFMNADLAWPDVTTGIKNVKEGRGHKRDALVTSDAARLLSSLEGAEERTMAEMAESAAAEGGGEGTSAPRRRSRKEQAALRAVRDRAMVELMLRRGLRTVEVSRAIGRDLGRVEDAEGNVRDVLYVLGKGRTEATEFVVLGDEVASLIDDWQRAKAAAGLPCGVTDPLFCSVSNNSWGHRISTRSVSGAVRDRMRECGVGVLADGSDDPRLSAHSLRHTAVTYALMGGATIQEAQSMARHSSIKTTELYAHNVERAKGVAEGSVDSFLDRRAGPPSDGLS